MEEDTDTNLFLLKNDLSSLKEEIEELKVVPEKIKKNLITKKEFINMNYRLMLI